MALVWTGGGLPTREGQGERAHHIAVHGARVHNLRHLGEISARKLMSHGTVGLGKDSLAFDTIYARSGATWIALQLPKAVCRPGGQGDVTSLRPALPIHPSRDHRLPAPTVGTHDRHRELLNCSTHHRCAHCRGPAR